ncbi:MAG TPA: DUF5916 domain-containing protein, partial [Gemmatimonadales bacterium]|nr:DUF5916 domain-containing protein [Gemmatimonadales bacterium]
SLTAIQRSDPIKLDGHLDEASWQAAIPGIHFTQQRPSEGAPATQQTEIRVLFDNEALYIGARMFDDQGAKGVRSELVRRDQETAGDQLDLIFDTYHDHVGRTSFGVNPRGVKKDGGVATSYNDPAWDAVWEVVTAVDSLGWTAEFRIPFSQLRFTRDPEQVWGLQVWRTESRLNEISMWSFWGLTESGGPPRFGHVEGIQIGHGQKKLEVLPYVVAQMERLQEGDPGDPFYEQHDGKGRVGGDLKYLVTNNLTLQATINPDFGQVEVDPAVVNLSAFETFFPERRPFFVEGGGVFGFGDFSCYFCSNVSNLGMFYSRRIGRQPQGDLPEGTQYADAPDATEIIGAAKLTGRSKSGWTLGLLEALTSLETAPIQLNGAPGSQEVEPLSNYFVGRLNRDLNHGNTQIGFIGTSVVRDLQDPLLAAKLSQHAEGFGLDWNHSWGNRAYNFMGQVATSNVAGSTDAMLRLQQSSARYFQRPDRENGSNGLFSNSYDPEATRLGGYAAYGRLAKVAGNWLWEGSVNVRSPGFEVNDLAFLTRASYLWGNVNVMRQFSKPTSWYRSAALIAGVQQERNYDGDVTDLQFHTYGRMEFLNNWSIGGFHIQRPGTFTDDALRGGPTVRKPTNHYSNGFFGTDYRRKVVIDLNGGYGSNAEGASGWDASVGITLKPLSNIQLMFRPGFSQQASSQQYVTVVDDATNAAFYGKRYVMARLDQTDFSMNTRVNVTFNPQLTLEVFLQPLISSVDYASFKEFDAPRELAKSVYGVDRGTIGEIRDTEGTVTGYHIDPDASGAAAAFYIDNPDFSFRSLRGNAVLRWEYHPGSTVYFVWTQSRNNFEPYVSDGGFSRNWQALTGSPTDNIFLIKFNYWLS